jgi:hypothetical protein
MPDYYAEPAEEPVRSRAETIAEAFHEAYERLAPEHGYETRPETSTHWADVPEKNKSLMVAVVRELLQREVI